MIPEVSIIIPCYKQAHFLPESIASALGQSYGSCEVLVVDDGSPDETGEVAARYPQVRYIRQENQGLSGARNTGISQARGQFLVFLDADDRLLPQAVEYGLSLLKECPDCAFVSGEFRAIKYDGTPLPPRPRPVVSKDHYRALLSLNYIGCPASVIYRREIFDRVGGFKTTLKSCEDYEMYLRIARLFPVRAHQQVVVEYRRHHDNMSSNAGRMLENGLFVLKAQREYVRGDRRLEVAWRNGLKNLRATYHPELLIEKMRKHSQARAYPRSAVYAFKLLTRYPAHFAVHASRKLTLTLGAEKSESLENS